MSDDSETVDYYEGLLDDLEEEHAATIARLTAQRDRLREALVAAEEYLAFHATEHCEPYPLDKVRAALKETKHD